MKLIFAVAAGGALGAVARHLMAHQFALLFGHGFPWGTFAVNLLGSFFLGGLIEVLAISWSPSEAVRGFLVVGVLGAFTTFSTFSMDAFLLYERGQWVAAALYIVASVVLSLAGFFVGLRLFRLVLA
jgi:CrcB protein